MWVRTQAKNCLIDIKSFYLRKDGHNYEIVGWSYDEKSAEENEWLLGKYILLKKAMSVLDELQYRIARTESGVFQMPEDDDEG